MAEEQIEGGGDHSGLMMSEQDPTEEPGLGMSDPSEESGLLMPEPSEEGSVGPRMSARGDRGDQINRMMSARGDREDQTSLKMSELSDRSEQISQGLRKSDRSSDETTLKKSERSDPSSLRKSDRKDPSGLRKSDRSDRGDRSDSMGSKLSDRSDQISQSLRKSDRSNPVRKSDRSDRDPFSSKNKSDRSDRDPSSVRKSDKTDQSGYFRFGVHASSPIKGASNSGIPRWNGGNLSPIRGPRRPAEENFHPTFAYSRSSNDISSMGLFPDNDSFDELEPFVSSTTTKSPPIRPAKKKSSIPPIQLKPPGVSSTTAPFEYSSSCSTTPTRKNRPPLDYLYYRPTEDDLPFINYLDDDEENDSSVRGMMELQRNYKQTRTYPKPSRTDWLENRKKPGPGVNRKQEDDDDDDLDDFDSDLKDYSTDAPPVRRNSHVPKTNLNNPKNTKGPKDSKQKKDGHNPFSYGTPPPITSLPGEESLDESDLYEDDYF